MNIQSTQNPEMEELSRFYGAMFEFSDFEALQSFISSNFIPKSEINNDEIIREFIESTPIWHQEMINKYSQCPICGIIPDNIKKVSEKLNSLLNK